MKSFKIFSLLAALLLSVASCVEKGGSGDGGTTTPPVSNPGNTMVIYEANPRVFASTKSLKAIEDRLDEIQDLGVNVLWLMPVHPIGSKNSVGSPYCVKDYKAVNSSFGTVDDLKSLVTKAHSMGMKVIMDWIANHTAWDNAWITDHPDWYTKDANGNIMSPANMGWNDVADLNFKNTQMRAAMIDAMKFWITTAGIDGFRCDYTDGVPEDFWTEAIKAIRTVKKDAFMLAESADTKYYNCGFDMLYGWNYQSVLADVFSGKKTVENLCNAHKAEYTGVAAGKERMRFSTNHDKAMNESSPITMYKGERGAMSAFVIAAYMGGVPMIYSSQEIGYSKTVNFFTNVLMDWNSNPDYTDEYQKVMAAYQETADLRGEDPVLYNTGNIVSIYYKGGLFVVANTKGSKVSVKTPMERTGDKVKDMVTGETGSIPAALELDAYEYKIWKIQK